jgi:hypothetical protein
MLMSLGLSVLLIAALVGIMQLPADEAHAARDRDSAASPAWGPQLVDLLRTDLQAAERWYANDDVAILLCRRSSPSDDHRHRPIFVQYRLEPIAGRSWLIRSEHDVSFFAARPLVVELIAPDVETFRLRQFLGPAPGPDASVGGGAHATEIDSESAVDPPIVSAAPFLDLEALARAMTPLPSHLIVECGEDGPSGGRSPRTWLLTIR